MKLLNRPVLVAMVLLMLGSLALTLAIIGCASSVPIGKATPRTTDQDAGANRSKLNAQDLQSAQQPARTATVAPPTTPPAGSYAGAGSAGGPITGAGAGTVDGAMRKDLDGLSLRDGEEVWVIEKARGDSFGLTPAQQKQPLQRQQGLQQNLDSGGSISPGSRSRVAVNGTTPATSVAALPKPLDEKTEALSDANAIDESTDLLPGSGQLLARRADQKLVPVPLKHTDVAASIAGYIASVDVTQQYHNPFGEKIEAVYVFPLPENAAVNEFLMTIGDRRIRGIIREREEAQRIYNDARAQGYVASLLTQERPNIFTQSVANIEPGKEIDVDVKYFHTLQYTDGWFEFVFPMVVGPRFNPSGYTEGIGAVRRGDRGVSNQTAEVQYLRPEERSGHDISLSVHVDAGVSIEQMECKTHQVQVDQKSPNVTDVKLASSDSIPNKDFVLRYKVAGDKVKSALLTHRDERGGFFTLMVIPPESLRELPRQPLEFVFTLDVSGSMTGQPIEQSKAAIRYCLTHMRPDDTFQIVRFASAAESMSQRPVPATKQNIAAALKYIEVMNAGGGTMMMEGIRESLNFPADESRLRFVSFLTDGYIGNETQILRELRKCRGDSRVFSFGVGSSPNRYLLDGMAKLGRGACAYLGLKDDASKVMADYFERISHPAMTDLSIDFGGMNATDVYPQKLPDVFVGRPVIITGRFNGQLLGQGTVKINGKVTGEHRTLEIPVDFSAAEDSKHNAALPAVWARAKLADLADLAVEDPHDDLPGQIKQVALEYGLMSAYTSFVAVDSSHRTTGDHGTTVAVPVPVPEGVRYETTVQEK